jgi:prephenate dehydratase
MKPVAAFDTAGAVEILMREQDGVTAAIAGRQAAEVYGATILAEHLQDHHENWTRFVLLSRGDASPAPARTTKVLLAFDVPHRPGSLVAALKPVSERQLNLTKIESRPIPTRPFEYRFIVELAADSAEDLAEVVTAMREQTVALRILGEYAAAGG